MNETFDEVFDECASVQVWDFPNGPMNYARRLKAAHESEIQNLLRMKQEYINLQKNIGALRREVGVKQSQQIELGHLLQKVSSALKPVMDCNTYDAAFGLDNALWAIRKAQDIIYDGGAK